MQAADIIKQFKYSTLQIMAKDLTDQIDDRDSRMKNTSILVHLNKQRKKKKKQWKTTQQPS